MKCNATPATKMTSKSDQRAANAHGERQSRWAVNCIPGKKRRFLKYPLKTARCEEAWQKYKRNTP